MAEDREDIGDLKPILDTGHWIADITTSRLLSSIKYLASSIKYYLNRTNQNK
jgi:hypothetical protein